MPARRSLARIALLATIGIVAVVVVGVWLLTTPSDEFVLTPDPPRSADRVVSVTGETREPPGSGIRYLVVLVHRPSIAESWISHFERGATVVPADRILPPGGNESDERRVDRLDIEGSKRVAAYVALKALGRPVKARGGGVSFQFVESPSARKAGLRPGMVIVEAGGKPAPSLASLREITRAAKPGDPLRLTVLDGDKRRTMTVRLVPDPQDKTRALIGVGGAYDVAPRVTLPNGVDVKIDTGNLGGPSAGQAFALEILDSLTKRSLSRGRKIAVTGTISLDGSVGAIGGMKQKAIAAREAGADLLLVPKDNFAEAKANAGDVPVVAVGSFADSVKALKR